mmetsp:Transcript_10663/g.32050  ORF Transcript_10663/g.32050 Transcript_10663/m.32050 type:complete len:212 (-) Transcript_10663:931-1566(-)
MHDTCPGRGCAPVESSGSTWRPAEMGRMGRRAASSPSRLRHRCWAARTFSTSLPVIDSPAFSFLRATSMISAADSHSCHTPHASRASAVLPPCSATTPSAAALFPPPCCSTPPRSDAGRLPPAAARLTATTAASAWAAAAALALPKCWCGFHRASCFALSSGSSQASGTSPSFSSSAGMACHDRPASRRAHRNASSAVIFRPLAQLSRRAR